MIFVPYKGASVDKDKISEAVCHAMAITFERSGREIPEFKDSDEPVGSYEGFDSLCGVEVTLQLEQLLGVDDLGTNIFVKGTGKGARSRTISEIVDCVSLKLTNGGGAA
jgi:hypothetical protein